MSSKAPDTRNKLDNNKGLNKKKFKKKYVKHPGKDKPVEKKESKGSLFKKEHGYSKTQKRLFQKNGIQTDMMLLADLMSIYVPIRKARKLVAKKVRQEKHRAAVTYRRTNSKSKGSKGSIPASKKK